MSTEITDFRLDAIAKEVELVRNGAIIRLGQLLFEAREIFSYRRDEGGFRGGTQKRLGIGHTTAYRLIGVYQRFGESVPVVDTLPATVLYALAEPSTPDNVRDAVVEKAAAGEKVTTADVKQLRTKLADKDEKFKKIKGQKEASDADNDRLTRETRAKSAEIERLRDQIAGLERTPLEITTAPDPLLSKPVDKMLLFGLTDQPNTPKAREMVALWDRSDEDDRRQFVASRWREVLDLGLRPSQHAGPVDVLRR